MLIDRLGWLENCLIIPSPNAEDRPLEGDISLVVIHAISLPPQCFGGPFITALFTNAIDPACHPAFCDIAALRVSSHLLIRRDGALVQYVSFLRKAWHAGVSCWSGRERCNDFSIGIELEGSDLQDFSAVQYQVLNDVLQQIYLSYSITDVCGHADIAPGRKTDPGPHFQWTKVLSLKNFK